MTKCEKIAVSPAVCARLFCPRVSELYKEGRVFVYGGLENGKLICAIALSGIPDDRTTLTVEDLYVTGYASHKHYSDRRIELIAELFDKAEAYFANFGISRFYVKLVEDPGLMPELGNLYLNCGFSQVGQIGHLVNYSAFDVFHSEYYLEASKVLLSANVQTETLAKDDIRLKKFNAAKADAEVFLDYQAYDPKLAQFYVRDNSIEGAVLAKKLKNGDVLIYEFYKGKNAGNIPIVPVLFVRLMEKIRTEIDVGAQIVIQTYGDTNTGGLSTLIGEEPNSDKMILEFVR